MDSPANDAHLIQLVRGALGRDARTRGLPRINVSSCKLVVTLHGSLPREQGRAACEVAREVSGVREVVCKLRVWRSGAPCGSLERVSRGELSGITHGRVSVRFMGGNVE